MQDKTRNNHGCNSSKESRSKGLRNDTLRKPKRRAKLRQDNTKGHETTPSCAPFTLMKTLPAIIGLVLLSTAVMAFNLQESYPIDTYDRQEARIDGIWLYTTPIGDSHIQGYITDPFVSGHLDLFYEGEGIDGKHHKVDTYIRLTDSYWGPYGLHFDGSCNPLIDGVSYKNIAVDGFYNPLSGQVYTSLSGGKLGVTWATFIN